MSHADLIGCPKEELDTPVLCLDLDRMEANIQHMATACRDRQIDWRPHAKCHKSPRIAKMLTSAGAVGVTCAKLGEAEVFAEAGVQDLLIANMIVGPKKLQRLAAVAKIADPIVCLDHIDQATAINQTALEHGVTVRAIIEVNIGLDRVGVEPGQPTLRLAEQVKELPGIRFAGIMAYEGHLLKIEDQQEKSAAIRAAIAKAVETKKLLESQGIPCDLMSCGGTGSYEHTIQIPGVTELQAGGAIFMDAFYRHACQVKELRYALTVMTTVVSRPTSTRVIIDAGKKTLSTEIFMPRVLHRDDIDVKHFSAEHGILERTDESNEPHVGERLELVPGYGDLTINLHDNFLATRNGRVVEVIPVVGRGRIR